MQLSPLASASAVVLCLATTASAQQQLQAVELLGPVNGSGLNHLASGAWTRNFGSPGDLGPDIIYRTDAPSGSTGSLALGTVCKLSMSMSASSIPVPLQNMMK